MERARQLRGRSSVAGTLLTAALCGCSQGPVGEVQLTVSSLATTPTRSATTSFTPTSFQLAIPGVLLFGDDEQSLYEPETNDPVEFVRGDGQPVIEANQEVPVGTYDALEVQVGDIAGDRVVLVAGCAVLQGEEHCTRTDPSQPSLGGAPEPVAVRSANFIDPVLPGPVEVTEGSTLELNLFYDLTDAVSFMDQPGPAPSEPGFGRIGFGDDTSIEVKYPPLFAFIGEPPPVEIYEIELVTDPDPSTEPNLEAAYYPLGTWHVRMWAFFDDGGEVLAQRDVWVAEEGADSAAAASMFTQGTRFTQNPDGTYAISEPNPDPDFQSWQIDAFERATHDGTATWTTPQGTKAIGYHATRLQ